MTERHQRELEHRGGVLILRSPANHADSSHFKKVGYVLAQTVNLSETRYEITESGRASLRSFNYQSSVGIGDQIFRSRITAVVDGLMLRWRG